MRARDARSWLRRTVRFDSLAVSEATSASSSTISGGVGRGSLSRMSLVRECTMRCSAHDIVRFNSSSSGDIMVRSPQVPRSSNELAESILVGALYCYLLGSLQGLLVGRRCLANAWKPNKLDYE
jgi:hypothetical protein